MESQYVYVNPWSELDYSWQQATSLIPFNGLGIDQADLPTVSQNQLEREVNEAKVTGLALGALAGVLLTWIFIRKG